MPWLAVPYDAIDSMDALAQFDLRSIPQIVLIDGTDGKTISLHGREEIEADPAGIEFPYRNRPNKPISSLESCHL